MIRLIVTGAAFLGLTSTVVMAQVPVTTPPPVVVPPVRTPAQDAAAAAGRNVSNAQIADAIKNSGLSEAQVRARLAAAGFDSKLADPFFSTGATGATPAVRGAADATFVNALQSLGILNTESPTTAEEAKADTTSPDAPVVKPNPVREAVFGKSVFSGTTSAFDPVAAGPVDASYRLGIGDQLQYVVTGDMEMALSLDVRRDGTVVLPQIGQVAVAGLTLEGARTLLSTRAGRVYSLINSGKARIDLSVSRVRSNQVFVVGEVERPGAYQLSALATVFRALVGAGGPTVRGSFRTVEVRRGGVLAAKVDLYDYLLRGDASKDIRTEQGDIIFVGLSTRLVAIQGAVRRPGVFELRDDEGFSNLLLFAGGLLPTAATERIQIDRVLPPSQRTPGRERAIIDIPFNANFPMLDTVKVFANDLVSVFSVGDIRRNQVVLRGEVFQPGTFEWAPHLTITQLLEKAQGLLPWALSDRVKIERPIVNTGRSEIFSLDLRDSTSRRFEIQEFDVITVLDGRRAFPSGAVSISGAVYSPGSRPYFENETLGDLIDVANGFQPGAMRREVKLTRTDPETGRKTQISFDMDDPASNRFRLQPSDAVLVIDARQSNLLSTVVVSGSVIRPGTHTFVDRQSLRDLLDVSGGLRPEAQRVDLARRRLGNAYNDTTSIVRTFLVLPNGQLSEGADTMIVERGDHINVRDNPGYRAAQEAVTLTGLFTYPGSYVLRRDGERLSEVVRRAGGPLPSAYVSSGRLLRGGRPVAVDFRKALAGDRVHDIHLEEGDQLSLGPDPSVVYVTGAVERQVVVPYNRSWSTSDYVAAAGGFTDDAARDNIVIEYPSGEIRRRVKHLFFSIGDLTVISGSTITVGRKVERKGIDVGELFTRTLQVTTTLVSIFLAYKTATR